jgi:lysophospholipase L1-like esterase
LVTKTIFGKTDGMEWYNDEIKRLEKEIETITYQPQLIFYGSSSIRLWEGLCDDFKVYHPLNLGFGGSTLEACVYYFNRVFSTLRPKQLVIYAGDNDLGDGKKPTELHNCFIRLCQLIDASFGNIPVFYISVKPSLSRWHINEEIKYANRLIEETIQTKESMHYVNVYDKMIGQNGFPLKNLYDIDGLHLSKEGYTLWKEILLTYISSKVDNYVTSTD